MKALISKLNLFLKRLFKKDIRERVETEVYDIKTYNKAEDGLPRRIIESEDWN